MKYNGDSGFVIATALSVVIKNNNFFLHSSDMLVRSIGNSLMVILPDLVGKKITNWFDLVRPMIAFKFQTVS